VYAQESVASMFEERVREMADAPAVEDESTVLTYRELNSRANRLARLMRDRGVRPEDRVAVHLARTPDLIVAMTALTKLGATYLPLDPAYPDDRLAYLIDDARPRLCLTTGRPADVLSALDTITLDDGETLKALAGHSDEDLGLPPCHPEQTVYIIYTSGSTGRPKNVIVPHRALHKLVQEYRALMPSGRRVAQFAAAGFDVSLQEVYTTLGAGGTVVLCPDDVRRDPAALGAWVNRRSVTELHLPNIALRALVDALPGTEDDLAPLTHVIQAGEAMAHTASLRRTLARNRGLTMHNEYGPTETGIVVIAWRGRELSPSSPEVPIGRPMSNVRVYVLPVAGPGGRRRGRGVVHRGHDPGHRLRGAERTERVPVRRGSLRPARVAHVPYRRPGPVERLRRAGVPGAGGRPGEDPRVPGRAGGGRVGAARGAGGGRGRGDRPRGRAGRPPAGRVRRPAAGRIDRHPRTAPVTGAAAAGAPGAVGPGVASGTTLDTTVDAKAWAPYLSEEPRFQVVDFAHLHLMTPEALKVIGPLVNTTLTREP
jgi:hypothetical protein